MRSILAGYPFLTRKFFELCARLFTTTDIFCKSIIPTARLPRLARGVGRLGTEKTRARFRKTKPRLVIWALWEHYDKFREIEFVRKFYRSLITKAADFMVSFRHEATRLPAPSWNLWEDRRGIHTFTCSTVVGGLRAAANFANPVRRNGTRRNL
jgi:hypothetical protein